tara:strand:+ start:5607 stop:7136 length:1530 start_codon:yes stop_codon:yes gene_type:complete
MFTDMVGYSKLTGDDQNLALELLKEHDKIIEPLIKKYEGSIVKRIGDAIVAIFDDSTNIIQSAVEIQQSLKNRNNRNTKSRHIILRIGLHHGEIILKNDEVYGLGYELASSIEPICEYGGIAVSQNLYDHTNQDKELILEGKNNHFFIRPIAKFKFKSISNKLMIYKLYLNLLDWYEEPQHKTHQYLKKQQVSSKIYDIKFSNKQFVNNTDHYIKAVHFHKQNNLSYALYHYKMCLDYEKLNNYDLKLSILYLFSIVGLNRLVDKTCNILNQDKSFNDSAYLIFIQAINYFNIKKLSKAQDFFEKSLADQNNTSFLSEVCYYLSIIFFQKKDFNTGLDLIEYYKKDFKANVIDTTNLDLIKSIFEYQKKPNNQLEKLITNKHSEFSNLTDNNYFALFVYWFLIQFYQNKNDANKALAVQDDARLLLNTLANQISGLQLKELFVEKPMLHQMLNEEIELNFISEDKTEDLVDIEDITKASQETFNFCVECGFKNEKNFSFCPSCGQKLTK